MHSRIYVILVFAIFNIFDLKSQIFGVEFEDGIIDTINFRILPWSISGISFCQDRCYQFYFIEREETERYIYYNDSILWKFNIGEPSYSKLKNPVICFPELVGPDTIVLYQKYYDKLLRREDWNFLGTTSALVILCPPVADFEPDRQVVCVGHPVVYADSSKQVPDQWEWIFEGGIPDAWSGSDPPPIYYMTPGVYATALYVANASGADSLLRTQLIEVREGPQPISSWVHAHTAPFGSTVPLSSCSTGDWYEWYPADGLSCTDCPQPTLTVGHQSQYRVITGLYGFDCVDTCDISIETLPVDELIWFPNAFSPNGDGINDLFTGYGKHIELVELKIFDRWGNALHSASGPQAAWDGTAKGRDVQPGSYVFYAIYKKLYTEETDIIYGEVSVFR